MFDRLEHCLGLADPAAKCAAVAELAGEVGRLGCAPDATAPAPRPIGAPGRPDRPRLVPPGQVPRRGLGSAKGRAALVHAIAHIEFNAINLALDAAYRFRGLPPAYYGDWVSVAADEARHYRMLEGRLAELGHAYGDFPAHDGLWRMAAATADSMLERMALVPRVLEARGLDVTPGMIDRLRRAGDTGTAALLEVILAEEERHVAIGTRWYRYCCEAAGVAPESTFIDLLRRHFGSAARGPLNRPARLRAGFSNWELEALASSTR